MPRLRPESEIRPPDQAHGLPLERWHAEDDHATEVEVRWMIGGMVWGLQPDVCIELGCYRGYTSRVIGHRLARNGQGRLYAIDSSREAVSYARTACESLPVEIRWERAEDWLFPQSVDFAFVDHGDPGGRAAILPRLLDVMSPRGVIVWHDTGDQFPLRRQLDLAVPGTGWRIVYLPTSRGVGIMSRWPEPTRTIIV